MPNGRKLLRLIGEQKCCYCGETTRLTYDHVVSKRRGGPNAQFNIVYCCRSCNQSKDSKKLEKWKPNGFFDIATNSGAYEDLKEKYLTDWYLGPGSSQRQYCRRHLESLRLIHDLRLAQLASIYDVDLVEV